MKISVAMTTYNGEKYLEEQLKSIINQTVPVSEIIVSDDGSTDSTLEIIKSFNDSRIKILTNNCKHGYCGNFEHAVKHTTGDVIFLSDQDDIWMPNKVERCVAVFEQNKDVELIISNGIMIDKDGNKLQDRLGHKLCLDKSSNIPKDKYLLKSVYSCLAVGMCMCFTKSLLDSILPFPYSNVGRRSILGHDSWIAFCALINDSAFYLHEPIVKYRIHETNTSIWNRNEAFYKKLIKRLVSSYSVPYDMLTLADAMLSKLDSKNSVSLSAFNAANQIKISNSKQIEIFNMNRVMGSIHLVKLYLSNELYRRNGIKFCISQFLFLWFRNKVYRFSDIKR